MPMASNHTCRVCSRAFLRSQSLISQARHPPLKTSLRIPPQVHRSLATSAPSSKNGAKGQYTKPHTGRDHLVMDGNATPLQGLAAKIREKAPLMTETYVAYGNTQALLEECARPGDYKIPQALEKNGEIPTDENGVHLGVGKGWWHETLGIAPTFSNWAQITFIHMYMLQVRFRMLPATHAPIWIQHLTNHAFYGAEDRLVVWHKFNSNSVRQKYLKDMFAQWRAVLLSYDEGLVKGDAMLAAALWRNLLGGREDVDFQKLAQVVGYMRRELRRLDGAADDEIFQGQWKFTSDPGAEADHVTRQSRMLSEEKKP